MYTHTLPTGTCTHHTVSGIYLYHLGRFVLFQEIKTAYAVQWMAVQVSGMQSYHV